MSFSTRWTAFRNTRLGDPAFQRWAAAFPPTRGKARGEAQALFDLVAGFVHSQVLAAFVELRLAEHLAGQPQDAATLARICDMPPESMQRLLLAAAALKLSERSGSGWTLGSRGAALRGNPGVAAMISHHRHLYADLADPVALLRRGGGDGALAEFWSYARSSAPDTVGPEAVSLYSALMAASQPMIADEVIAAYPLYRHRRLLDIGGGEGAFLTAVARAVPGLDLALFDLPAVAERARVALDRAGLQRVATRGGSFFDGGLPTGFDAMSLVRILHDHDDAPALALLEAARAALPDGGTLLVAEPMAGVRPSTVSDSYFGFYLLAMGSGRARRPDEIAGMLRDAGFSSSRTVATRLPMITGLVVATA